MAMTMTQSRAVESNYGGFADALGGIATIVLAIFGLAGVSPDQLLPIAVIVFGAALLIQGGTLLSEYAGFILPAETAQVEHFGGGSLSALFIVGAAGIVLGVLALVGIHAAVLSAVAIIAFGSALLLSSQAVMRLQLLKTTFARTGGPSFGAEVLAGETAAGSAGTQALIGLAAVVLGILAVAGVGQMATLSLVAMLALGAAIVLTGSTLSGAVLSFMKPTSIETERPSAFRENPYQG